FGMAVEPEVYWRKATASPRIEIARQSGDVSLARQSVASQCFFLKSRDCWKSWSVLDRSFEVVNTTEGSASRAIACSLGRVRLSLAGCGGYAGIAIMPA